MGLLGAGLVFTLQIGPDHADQISLDHIADALDVHHGLHQRLLCRAFIPGQHALSYLPEIGHDLGFENIHLVVTPRDFVKLLLVLLLECIAKRLHHFQGDVTRPLDLPPRILQRDRWRFQRPFIEKLRFYDHAFGRGTLRYQPLGQARKQGGKTNEQQRVDHIEHGVGIGDLTRHLGRELCRAFQPGRGRGYVYRDIGQDGQEWQPYQHAGDVEGNVHHGGTHRLDGLAQRGKQGSGTGADIGPQRQRDPGRQGQQTLARHRDSDPDRRCG